MASPRRFCYINKKAVGLTGVVRLNVNDEMMVKQILSNVDGPCGADAGVPFTQRQLVWQHEQIGVAHDPAKQLGSAETLASHLKVTTQLVKGAHRNGQAITSILADVVF
jgi:hypothetical protein